MSIALNIARNIARVAYRCPIVKKTFDSAAELGDRIAKIETTRIKEYALAGQSKSNRIWIENVSVEILEKPQKSSVGIT